MESLTPCLLVSPFLQFVSSTETFDQQLSSYVSTSYVQEKYSSPHSTSTMRKLMQYAGTKHF